jgi:phosphate:Na+ symporter
MRFLSGIGVFLFAVFIIDKTADGMQMPARAGKYLKIPAVSFSCGLLSAALTQSSSAVNSIIAALRDKDGLDEKTCYFAVAGSNIGTTVTAYLAAMQNVTLSAFFSCIVFFATLCAMIFKNKNVEKAAVAASGFSIIFVSFSIIGRTVPEMVKLLDMGFLDAQNPFIPFGISLLLTAVCQSSALVSVIVIAFANLGLLPAVNAFFMIMAANLGTCSTVFLVSIGKSKKSLKVAFFNLIFNLAGVLLFTIFYYTGMLNWFLYINVAVDTKIALFNTMFNAVCCFAVCPFIKFFTEKINTREKNRLAPEQRKAVKIYN